jgi:hypothetical protein
MRILRGTERAYYTKRHDPILPIPHSARRYRWPTHPNGHLLLPAKPLNIYDLVAMSDGRREKLRLS